MRMRIASSLALGLGLVTLPTNSRAGFPDVATLPFMLGTVPEPPALALVALGGLALAGAAWPRRRVGVRAEGVGPTPSDPSPRDPPHPGPVEPGPPAEPAPSAEGDRPAQPDLDDSRRRRNWFQFIYSESKKMN